MDLFDIAVARKLSGGGGGGGGSSDFTTCTVTVTGVNPIWAAIPIVLWDSIIASDSQAFMLEAGETYQVPLYKGVTVVYADHLMGTTIEGNAEIVDDALIITGDFTIGYK